MCDTGTCQFAKGGASEKEASKLKVFCIQIFQRVNHKCNECNKYTCNFCAFYEGDGELKCPICCPEILVKAKKKCKETFRIFLGGPQPGR